MKTIFTTTDIVNALKIPFGRLREWILNYVKPSIPSPGQGQAAGYTLTDVYKIQIFKTMVEGGLSRNTASEYLSKLTLGEEQVDILRTISFRRVGGDIAIQVTYSMAAEVNEETGESFRVSWDESDSFEYEDDHTFDDIYILNFGRIKRDVDLRLTKQ